MKFLLVPHAVSCRTVTIWVAAICEADALAGPLSLEFVGDCKRGPISLGVDGWEKWTSYSEDDPKSYPLVDRLLHRVVETLGVQGDPIKRALHYQRIEVNSLEPRTSYSLRLLSSGKPVNPEERLALVRFTTLPERLPMEKGQEKPLTLLLGSCFYKPEDPTGLIGNTYNSLPEDERPDVKILCGDQVYLDNPWFKTTFTWLHGNATPGVFRAKLLQKYVNTWEQVVDEDAGFRRLLEDGANYFCSDDHEFWNNAPNFGGVGLVNTLTRDQRCWWFREAAKLFRAFQSSSTIVQFRVGQLSVCVADTRIERDMRSQRFMDECHLEEVEEWIERLEGPGVLVVGQPVLARKTGIRLLSDKGLLGAIQVLPRRAKSFSLDGNLPDYPRQYKKLVRCIKSSRHSIVVLTGDVHFGRVAHGELRPGSDKKFVEVISSPMRAVSVWNKKPAFGRYKDAPTEDFPGLKSLKVTDKQDHFATVQFSLEAGDKVRMKVKYWLIPSSKAQTPQEPEVIFQTVLS